MPVNEATVCVSLRLCFNGACLKLKKKIERFIKDTLAISQHPPTCNFKCIAKEIVPQLDHIHMIIVPI